MSSSATNDGERPEEATPAEAQQQPEGEAAPAEQPPQGEQLDPTLWVEPQVASRAIFTELFRTGGKSLEELQWLLSTHQTTLGWADYWAQQGYLTQVQSNGGQRFQLSHKAVLELEL